MRRISSPLTSISPAYFDSVYQSYLSDRNSIEDSWRALFDIIGDLDASRLTGGLPSVTARAQRLAEAYRNFGHRLAWLDPLATPDAGESREAELLDILASTDAPAPNGSGDFIEALRSIYASSLAVELGHLDDPALRAFLVRAIETAAPAGSEERRGVLRALRDAEEFEGFLRVKYPTKKRFGLEGGEALLPLLTRIIETAAAAGVTDVVIGSMHRGRLNLMANLLDEPLVELLAKFKGVHPFAADPPITADVLYHLGVSASLSTAAGPVTVTLAPNPSHLEAVNAVVLGRVRARQDLAGAPRAAARVLGLILHTDASVIGQGSVAETIQLSGITGYATGGTIHVIVNNQIGFTTETSEARTSRYCTGAWKAIDSAILHVNGNDPDAAIRAADIAVSFRQAHARDAVIDFVCYRRNGHNEIDEPRFTQPSLYRLIDAAPLVSEVYAERLIADGVIGPDDPLLSDTGCRERLQAAYKDAATYRTNRSGVPGGLWAPYRPAGVVDEPDTGVPEERLNRLLARLSEVPAGITIHPKLARLVRERAEIADGLPWATAEALAFATLLTAGTPVRLSGQDVTRGAFSQRHFALTDVETGRRHISLVNLAPDQAPFTVINSLLSEYAVLGFEYGYSVERPDALVIWEAQFGDFANGAQIILDQFVVSGEEKWMQPSGLVMLLPHGLEGQGPEHSSARIERLLQLAARDNIQIANPSTPANYFHLLRRQMLRAVRKPLLIIAPKTLLRLPAAVSPLAAFTPGNCFSPVIASTTSDAINRVLLCSGKIAYELEAERRVREARDVAVVRLEQLYPFPDAALSDAVKEWREASFVWVQEEPENMGAWSYVDRRIERMLTDLGMARSRVGLVSRAESPSPAGSFHGDHERDQRAVVQRAFD